MWNIWADTSLYYSVICHLPSMILRVLDFDVPIPGHLPQHRFSVEVADGKVANSHCHDLFYHSIWSRSCPPKLGVTQASGIYRVSVRVRCFSGIWHVMRYYLMEKWGSWSCDHESYYCVLSVCHYHRNARCVWQHVIDEWFKEECFCG